MANEQVSAGDRSELTSIIRDIRKRWRLKLAVCAARRSSSAASS